MGLIDTLNSLLNDSHQILTTLKSTMYSYENYKAFFIEEGRHLKLAIIYLLYGVLEWESLLSFKNRLKLINFFRNFSEFSEAVVFID